MPFTWKHIKTKIIISLFILLNCLAYLMLFHKFSITLVFINLSVCPRYNSCKYACFAMHLNAILRLPGRCSLLNMLDCSSKCLPGYAMISPTLLSIEGNCFVGFCHFVCFIQKLTYIFSNMYHPVSIESVACINYRYF